MASTTPEARASWHRRLATRYAAVGATVALGSTVLAAVPLYLLAAHLLEEALEERLEGNAELAALELGRIAAAEGVEAIHGRLAVLREEADLDAIYLVRPDGEVMVADPDPGAAPLTDIDREALRSAEHSDAVTTPIQTGEDGAFLCAFAPTDDPRVLLGVRGSASYLDRLESLRTIFAIGAVTWGVGVAMLGAFMGARLTRPIHRLLDATSRIAAGLPPEPPEPAGAVELDTLQEAFAAMADSVRQRERRLRALAGAVAHEVRNPSNALRLHLGLLRRDVGPEAPDGIQTRLAVLEEELDALDATVDGFLVFAHDRRARRSLVPLRELLERSGDGAPVDCPDERVPVDPLLLGRAVGNVVRNARQAGGEPVRIRATIAGDSLRIEVEDSGPGFPGDLLPHAFEPFVSGRPGGSGIGLAIVAAVAAAHGGRAEVVRSGPGGTVVALEIPLGQD